MDVFLTYNLTKFYLDLAISAPQFQSSPVAKTKIELSGLKHTFVMDILDLLLVVYMLFISLFQIFHYPSLLPVTKVLNSLLNEIEFTV